MKNLIIRVLAPLSLTLMLLAGVGQAQYAPRITNVKVPFDFTANNQTYPAGDYSVLRTAPNRIVLRDAQFHVLASLMTIPVSANKITDTPKLEFYSSDGAHALLRVWFENDDYGNEVPQAKSNLELAKQRRPSGTVQASAGSR